MNDITTRARARALLAAATPGPLSVYPLTRAGRGFGVGRETPPDHKEGICEDPLMLAEDAELFAAAPELIAALCDQLDDALEECRLKRAADEDFLDDYTDGYLSEVEDQLAAAVAERNALRAEVERLKARRAEMCDCIHATGRNGETLACVDADCPKCGGTGGVFVEGQQ